MVFDESGVKMLEFKFTRKNQNFTKNFYESLEGERNILEAKNLGRGWGR